MTYHPKRMLKGTYDPNEDGVVDNADQVDGAHAGTGAGNILKIPADITHGDLFFVDATGNVTRLAPGTAGYFLKTQGAGADPVWAAATATVWSVVTTSSDYTATDGEFVLADSSTSAITITLPSPAENARVGVKKTDSSTNTVTVSPAGAETIDGASSLTIDTQYESYTLISDGTNWYII